MIRKSRRRKRAMFIVGTVLLMLAAASAVYVVPSAAVDPPPPIAAEQLTARSRTWSACVMATRRACATRSRTRQDRRSSMPPRLRPQRLQRRPGGDGLDRHVLRGTRNGPVADPGRPCLLDEPAERRGRPVG